MLHMRRLASRYRLNHMRVKQTQGAAVIQLKTIFVSYSRRDAEFALQLIEDLREKLGESFIDLWLDQTHIPPGVQWDDTIEQALGKSAAMLLILSDDSVQSQNVKNEWTFCLDENKPIIPILKDPCKLPLRLRNLNYVDYTNQPYSKALTRTLEALKKL